MNTEAEIEVSGLGVRYDGHEVLRDIGFVVRRGEFVSVAGRSGVGKSSLLHAMAGFIPRVGTVRMPAEFGVVLQQFGVFPWLTVRGNVAFGLGNLDHRRRAEILSRHLELTGLAAHAQKYPSQLSGGQVQRVALARALAPGPQVLLMDEPFGSLDAFTRDQMQNWLLELWSKDRKTVLFVTHNIEEAIYLSDRILVLGNEGLKGAFDVPFDRPRQVECKYDASFVELKRLVEETIRRG